MSVQETDVVDDEQIEDEETETEAETDSSDDEPVTDNVGDPSVEINIEELLQALEAESMKPEKQNGGARHRLEELMESRRAKRDLEDFDDYIV